MKTLLQQIFRDESGATAIEYGLLISLVGLAAAFGMKTFGDALFNQYIYINNHLIE
ncbi:MAG: Flp family type IVb pilin [Novosphingobium sp.]|jgi:pilus assembly protein Flp/PilA|uniref:Flp family type IVb pilin n=1 Tax=Novosphingobium sp. TaxID=1874826 RepID=UPI0027365771|nr:Flp family type IVb pilin [Novosphingobium sp.]MDP3551366.1 Flp family type IVb pilin [Novosphingobium sp.]